jgi:hypothetical protein
VRRDVGIRIRGRIPSARRRFTAEVLGGVPMSVAATRPATDRVVEPIHDDPPLVTSGLIESYRKWWGAVEAVHAILVRSDAATDEVTEALNNERRLRRDYAGNLRGTNRQVPDYLDDDKAFPPLWPTPTPPIIQR